MLTAPELDAMNTEFEAFEAGFRQDGSLERLSALADRLITRYRPDPVRMAEAAAMASPCGH
jgi:hypothetical protein